MAEMADMISVHEHTDPDAQATVTDFIDYTEYLPSDLERALILTGKLDETYETATAILHGLLKDYCELPVGDDKQASVLEAEYLRAKISNKLDIAINSREAAFVEATRLNHDMHRHKTRLASIHTKLLALPKPPSRDPTPQPVQSPQTARRDVLDAQRLKLRVDGARAMKKLGVRPTPRVIVPGEVLPPRNPDSPTASMYDDFTSSDSSDDDIPRRPLGRPRKLFKTPKPPKIPKLKLPKIPKEKKERPPRPPRPFGVMGTNAHSAVAGISTSNALMLLEPPPPDAKLGSEHAPWMRLTEWEMAKLRKRMKKNAIWAPSDTMIRRELADSGRGPEAYYAAKSRSEQMDGDFVDFDDLANRDKTKPLLPGEIPLDSAKSRQGKLFNRGMTLNVQKKKKREEEALQAKLDAEQANASLSSLGSKMSALFTKAAGASVELVGDKIVLKSRKRKRDSGGEESPTEESKANAQLHSEIILASKPARKWGRTAVESSKLDDSIITTTSTTSVPLAAAAASPKRAAPVSPAVGRKPKGGRNPIKETEVSTTAASSKPTSRQSSRRPSTAPEIARDHLRRKSTTPAPQAPANSRLRNRRQAPGPVTNSTDGGAAVSIGKRKNAPRKKGVGSSKRELAAAAIKADETPITDEEAIDPNEETYCVCGGVSFGIMIMCENPECEKEWFHLECVGLKEAPARRSKWWCPDCRVRLGL